MLLFHHSSRQTRMAPLHGSLGRRTEPMILLFPGADPTPGPIRSADIPSQPSRGQRCTSSSPSRSNGLAMILKVVLDEGRERFWTMKLPPSKFLVSENYLWKRGPLLIWGSLKGFLLGEPRLVFLINSLASGEDGVERSSNSNRRFRNREGWVTVRDINGR